ncbi:MAG: multidrug ABC transporter permease [Actinomycetota bacterium]|nr:MAG: multidrug ABC transporter permease [Actinomycetota bacterium]
MTSTPHAVPPAGSAEEPSAALHPAQQPVVALGDGPLRSRLVARRIGALSLQELQKINHDKSEVLTRSIQPALWLLIFGTTVSQLQVIPTGDLSYLDFLAPGILAQSALFVAIFYGIQIIWDRDAGVLSKLLVTPTPRSALVTGKAFAAGVRGVAQAIVVITIAALLGVDFRWNPLSMVAALIVVVVSAGFFACLSITIAGLVRSRDRLIGVGQAIMMPLFFASNALYPVDVMPAWLQWVSRFNPLSYEVDALRGLLVGAPAHLWLDAVVLLGCLVAGVCSAAALLGRLTR